MSTAWLKALEASGVEVKSARDATQVKGWLDTGNYALNWAISGRLQRGYPLGHMVEISGDPATGKSFLVARALAMVQSLKGVALLDDTEGAYNGEYAERLGVDMEKLAYVRSRTVKDHLKAAQGFIDAYTKTKVKGPAVLALDSLAQLTTEHELEVQLDKRDMTKAAELKAFYRIVGSRLIDLPILHLTTNHTIANIGNPFQPRTTPGGGGPKFLTSVRLDLRAISKIRVQADYLGVICHVVVAKNRFIAPWKEVWLSIPFTKPISRASGLVPLLLKLGVLKEQGQFITYDGKRIGRTYKAKDRVLEQDETGEQLLDQFPEILDTVDQELALGVVQGPAVAEPIKDDEEE